MIEKLEDLYDEYPILMSCVAAPIVCGLFTTGLMMGILYLTGNL